MTGLLVAANVAAALAVLLAGLARRPYVADVALLALAFVAVTAGVVLAVSRLGSMSLGL